MVETLHGSPLANGGSNEHVHGDHARHLGLDRSRRVQQVLPGVRLPGDRNTRLVEDVLVVPDNPGVRIDRDPVDTVTACADLLGCRDVVLVPVLPLVHERLDVVEVASIGIGLQTVGILDEDIGRGLR